MSSLLIMISIGYVLFFYFWWFLKRVVFVDFFLNRGFNFFGFFVIRSVSVMFWFMIDICRMFFIWIVLFGLGWEMFKWL